MSELEETLAAHIRYAGLPQPEREYRFHKTRRWRFDMAYPSRKLAIEVEGGTWINGRHNRGSGSIKDMDKYNAAALDGWRVLRFSGNHIKSGDALMTIEKAVNEAGVVT